MGRRARDRGSGSKDASESLLSAPDTLSAAIAERGRGQKSRAPGVPEARQSRMAIAVLTLLSKAERGHQLATAAKIRPGKSAG